MIRGTTPTHSWEMPFPASAVKAVRVTYTQDKTTILEKTESDCTIADNLISVKLTQEDTLNFEALKNASVQVKVLTTAGDVVANDESKIVIQDTLNEEVLV